MTDRSEANQCLLLLKVPGDTNTPLYLSGHREIPTLPYYAEVDHFVKGRPHIAQVYPGDTNTPVNTAERLTFIQRQPYRLCRTYCLFSSRVRLHTEESLSGRQTADVNSNRSVSQANSSYTTLYMPLKHLNVHP